VLITDQHKQQRKQAMIMRAYFEIIKSERMMVSLEPHGI